MGHGGDVIAEPGAAHREVEEFVARIQATPSQDRSPTDADLDAPCTKLVHEVSALVRDGKDILFPELRESCPPQALIELGENVRHATKTGPTRPHARDATPTGTATSVRPNQEWS